MRKEVGRHIKTTLPSGTSVRSNTKSQNMVTVSSRNSELFGWIMSQQRGIVFFLRTTIQLPVIRNRNHPLHHIKKFHLEISIRNASTHSKCSTTVRLTFGSYTKCPTYYLTISTNILSHGHIYLFTKQCAKLGLFLPSY